MKFRKLAALCLAVIMALSVVGCSGKTEPAETEAPAPETTAGTTAPAEVQETQAPTVDRSKELVIYSNSTANGQDEWLINTAKEAGFNLIVETLNPTAVAERLRAEKNNPVCDVMFGYTPLVYESLKAEGLLVQYVPEWVDEVDVTLGDAAESYYYPTVLQPLLLAYNKDVVTDPPKDWIDLCDPKYAGQYNLLKITGGTAKTILAGILVRYTDPNGEYGISEEGWKIAEQFIRNGHYQQDGEDWVGNVVSGAVPMTELWGAGVIRYQNERGIEFGLMLPEVGEPFVVEQIAMIQGCDDQALAQDFINWFGSAEIQVGWSGNAGAIPVNTVALAAIDNPEIQELMTKVKKQDMDWAFIAEHVDDWVEKVQLEFLD